MDEHNSDRDFTGMTVTSQPADEIESARHDIEQTRANMGETLDAIREKLDPKQMMDQAKSTLHDVADDMKNTVHTMVSDVSTHAKETAKDATSGAISGAVDEVKEAVGTVVDSTKKAGSNMMETVKNNPIPSMILLGAGWYILSRRKPTSSGMDSVLEAALQNPIPAALAIGTAMHLYHSHGSPASVTPVSGVASTAGDLAHKASDMVAEAKDTIVGAVGSAVDTVKETAGKATDVAGSLAGSVGDGVKHAGSSLKDMVHTNPLTVGMYALGVGAAIAMLLPDTEPENHLMGGARDSLVSSAHQAAGNLLDKVHTASSDAIDAIPQIPQLTSGDPAPETPSPIS